MLGNLGPRVDLTRNLLNLREAFPASALPEYAGRGKIAMGTMRKICRQPFHFGICLRLSAPISQTKRCSGNFFLKAWSVSTVNNVPSSNSISVTTIRGSSAIASAEVFRVLKSFISFVLLRGFWGDTIHQTSSRFRRDKAPRVMCRCPLWAGLNDPPKRPMHFPSYKVEKFLFGLESSFMGVLDRFHGQHI